MITTQPIANASWLGNEPNIGVKGFRGRTRSDSDALRTFENPQAEVDPNSKTQQPVAKQIWGSEDDATIARKHENWKRLRELQERESNRKVQIQDGIKALLAIWLFRQFSHRIGFSARKFGTSLFVLGLIKTLYDFRAPRRLFPIENSHFSYPAYPIIGQIGAVLHIIKNGGADYQIKKAKANNFSSDEIVFFGNPRETSLMDPRDREHFFKTNWKNYAKNGLDGTGFQENFFSVMGRGIFAVDGEEWQDHRKVASHLFSANGLKSKMEKSFVHHGDKLIHLLQKKVESQETVDFQDVMANLTFETICDIAFGVAPGSMEAGLLEGKKIDFLVRFDRTQQNCVLRFILPSPLWKTMRFLNVGFERTLREDSEELMKYVRNIIRTRHANGSFETADDLLSMYVRTAKATGKAYMMDESYLIDAVLNFMIAGRDTTSCTLTNLFKLLPTNPGSEEKMLDEFDRVVGKGNQVTWDHIRDLRYTGACFNETLRMYPPVGSDFRTALADDILPSGLHIEAGQRVSISNIAIGRDPHLWAEPDKFIPERWMQEDKPTRRPQEFIFPVFYGGPRLCLGKDMARLEVLSIAYAILSKYKIDVLSHSEKMVNGPVQFYEHGLPVKISSRS